MMWYLFGINVFLIGLLLIMIYLENKSHQWYKNKSNQLNKIELEIQREWGEAIEANRQAQQLLGYAKEGFADGSDEEIIETKPTKH